jgi:hypothetical protein
VPRKKRNVPPPKKLLAGNPSFATQLTGGLGSGEHEPRQQHHGHRHTNRKPRSRQKADVVLLSRKLEVRRVFIVGIEMYLQPVFP